MTTYTSFILYRALPAWLRLSRSERKTIFSAEVMPVLAKYQSHIKARLFDAEAFHARVSDLMLISCTDLQQYYFFIEDLRDTSLFGKPYLELVDVLITIEDGFQTVEANQQKP